MIEIYTDGSSLGNPGPGGYAAILTYGKHEKILTEGFRKTTNNRMELLAVIKGLEAINKLNQPVTIYTDSKYVADAVSKGWVFGWEKKGFNDKKNADLWVRFLKVYRLHQVKLVWVRGHAGHAYNERCDVIAVKSAKEGPHLIDAVFEGNE